MDRQDDELFWSALHSKKKARVHFRRVDGSLTSRLAAPLDFGPVRRERGHPHRYQFWDYEARPQHWLSLPRERILRIESTDEGFDPGEFITWDLQQSPWSIPRDWGNYS